jgi:hypothetical protein
LCGLETYHLKPLLHWGRTLEVLCGSGDVEIHFLLAEIDHVAGEKRLAMLLEVLLISIQHAIEPWKEFLGAVIGVENDGNAIGGSNSTDIVGSRDSSCNRSLLFPVCDTFSCEISSCYGKISFNRFHRSLELLALQAPTSSLAHLENDWGFCVAGSL